MVMAMGIMMAMIDIGPKPGSIPIKVPTKQPPTTIRILVMEKAVPSPSNRPSSIASPFYVKT